MFEVARRSDSELTVAMICGSFRNASASATKSRLNVAFSKVADTTKVVNLERRSYELAEAGATAADLQKAASTAGSRGFPKRLCGYTLVITAHRNLRG